MIQGLGKCRNDIIYLPSCAHGKVLSHLRGPAPGPTGTRRVRPGDTNCTTVAPTPAGVSPTRRDSRGLPPGPASSLGHRSNAATSAVTAAPSAASPGIRLGLLPEASPPRLSTGGRQHRGSGTTRPRLPASVFRVTSPPPPRLQGRDLEPDAWGARDAGRWHVLRPGWWLPPETLYLTVKIPRTRLLLPHQWAQLTSAQPSGMTLSHHQAVILVVYQTSSTQVYQVKILTLPI